MRLERPAPDELNGLLEVVNVAAEEYEPDDSDDPDDEVDIQLEARPGASKQSSEDREVTRLEAGQSTYGQLTQDEYDDLVDDLGAAQVLPQ